MKWSKFVIGIVTLTHTSEEHISADAKVKNAEKENQGKIRDPGVRKELFVWIDGEVFHTNFVRCDIHTKVNRF